MVPAWVADWIGIPFAERGRDPARGLDCWGLVRLAAEAGFAARGWPDFTDRYHSTRARGIPAIFDEQMRRWHPVDTPRPGDVVVLRIAGQPRHVGLVVGRGLMLSIERGTASCLERLDDPRWRGRIEGYYRHREAGHAIV